MADLPDKQAALIDWYLAVVEAADLSDKRYGIKGMNVWTRYGFRARRNLDEILIREIEATGSEAVEFPALIPATEFAKEKEHIKGFDAQVYWVTKGGLAELDIPLVLRPTSETAMYPIFALWVRSHKDLPLNVYQIVNTFRYETKTTRPFLRVREIHFFEEHTCQVDEAHASERVRSNLAAFRRMAEAFCLPYVAGPPTRMGQVRGSVLLDRPRHPDRAGPHAPDRERAPLPRQLLDPYEIRYEASDGSRSHVHQTTFGLSERLLGAIVAVHGDERGAIFPSQIAPYQVVIVPIPKPADRAALDAATDELVARLSRAGVRVFLDRGEERPGAKYYRWELKGVPLRLEVGPREVEARRATAVDRLGTKTSVDFEHLEPEVSDGFVRSTTSSFAEPRSGSVPPS